MGRTWKERWQALRKGLTRGVVWDLFMVYLALLNLGLIIFDLSYLWLRPFYVQHIPVVTQLYDRVKEIEPEPVTEKYLELVDTLSGQLEVGASGFMIDKTLARLQKLSLEIVDDNPFERSGLERNRIQMFFGMYEVLESEGVSDVEELEVEEVIALFWSREPDAETLKARVEFFQTELSPLLEANYFRRYGPDGNLADYFWILDLPFLVIFILEFFTRWYLAAKRRTYPRWFFFPIFNWYDVLGILPFKQFRLFRLFRIVAIYVRLHKSQYSVVGDDPISRTVKYFANIITEEISDMVALRILNDTQEEMREGTHKRIITSVTLSHRDALAEQLAQQIGQQLTRPEVIRHARGFLDANLEQAVDSADVLRRLPIPDSVLRPIVEVVGRSVFDAFTETLSATLESDEGQQAVAAMISDAIDGLVREVTDGQLEEVVRELSIEVIEHLKETVAVRKWALPDQPRRSIFTRELVE